jgi:uncharacterized membrane protein YfcA
MSFHNTLAGLLVGLLVGLTGMGGGSLMAPVLIVLFHYKAKVAIGSDLVYAAIAKIFGAWQHHRAGTVDLQLVKQLAIGSVPASLLGVWMLHSIDKHNGAKADHFITQILGAVLILVSTIMLARSIEPVEKWLKTRFGQRKKAHPGWAIAFGAIGGLLVGLTSIGSGTLFGVALIVLFRLSTREMVGTDIFHAAILMSAAAVGHILSGNVDYPLVGSLVIGAIPGILIGGHLCARVPEKALRYILAVVLLLTGLRIVYN